MPVIGGFIASVFGWLFALFAKQLTLGLAAAAAFVGTSALAFAAVRFALIGVQAAIGSVAPPSMAPVLMALSAFMPSNLSSCITAVLLMDTIATHYDYWRNNLPIAFQLAKS